MKVKLVVIDLEIPPSVKKWGIRLGIPLAVLIGGSGLAWAAMLHTWNNGDPLKADDLNGNFAALQGEIAALQQSTAALQQSTTGLQQVTHPPSAFRAYLTTVGGLNVGNGAQTPIQFNQVDYDLAHEYDPGSGKFTAANSGVYLVSCEFFGFAAGDAGVFSATLFRNGTGDDLQVDADDVQNSSTTTSLTSHAMAVLNLKQGDYLICSLYQTTGGNITLGNSSFSQRTNFSAARLD
jgi:C1q domain